MTPLPAEVEARIEEIKAAARRATLSELHGDIQAFAAREMAEFDREYWTEEVCLSCGNKDCGKQWTFAACVTSQRGARAEWYRRNP